MNNSIAYTPLECLLLFQSLVTHGAEDQDFVRISDLLTTNPLVKDSETYDAQRLSADALRDLYLKLLRDELRAEEQDGSEEASQASSKKRKVPTPPLPSVKDAYEYKDKLPRLVDRLYARYREYAVQAIAEDERRYAALQQEISDLEREEGQRTPKDAQAGSKNGPASSSQPATNGTVVEPPAETHKQQHPDLVLSPRSESRPEGLAISDVLNNQETPSSSPKISGPLPGKNISPVNHQRTGSNGPNGPSPFQPPPGPYHPGGGLRWEPPYGPGHQPPPYQTGPYPQYNPQYAQAPGYPPPRQASFSSPHLPPPHPHVPSSPVNAPNPMILPPPNPSRSPSTPGMPLTTPGIHVLADMAGPHQYRHPSGSPMMQQGSMNYQQPYTPQQRPSSGNGQPSWNQNPQFSPPQYPPPQPPQPQPFQYPPNAQQAFAHPLQQPQIPPYNSPYNVSQGPRPLIKGVAKGISSLPSTPQPRGQPVVQTGSGTRWTPQTMGTSTPRIHFSKVSRPPVEPISPTLQPARLPEPEPEPQQEHKPETESASEETPKPARKLAKNNPRAKPPPRGAQRTRAGSTASSVLVGSRRSQSVMSHADELSVDGRLVKEEVATPTAMAPEDPGDTTADEREFPHLPLHSHARPSHALGAGTKRKRASSINEDHDLDPELDDEPRPRPTTSDGSPPTHVVWTRAFPKISASALEAITGHKNASTFANPVKERDAPGYKNLILRPQDLKSIRSAINHGHKAATALCPADANPNASSVMLPIHEDIIPPKGIINYPQLEKELMRMFANAVMFNADPDRGFGRRWRGAGSGVPGEDPLGYEIDEDGVVKDTKHMFADVEKIVGSLRSAERRSEEIAGLGAFGGSVKEREKDRDSSVARASTRADDEDDEATADGESHTGTIKRRRKA